MAILKADHIAPQGGFFEPQRSFSWSLEIALDDAGDQNLIMQGLESFEAPRESNEEIELGFANEKRYVAGRTTYEASPLVLKDFVDVGVANAVVKWRRQVYNPDTGSIGLARDYKKTADLTLIAPDQSIVRIWKLIGIWPQAVEYGDLDMTTSDYVKITTTLRYDKAVPGEGLNIGIGSINIGNVTLPI